MGKDKKTIKMKHKKKGFMVGAGCMAVMVVLGSAKYAISYFTDQETKTNIFTVGEIDISLSEPKWSMQENILPLQIIDLDPTVTNEGVNDAFVFMQVDVPCADVVTASKDGTRQEVADTELFDWKEKEGWTQVGEVQVDETMNIHTYTYAYGSREEMTALVKDEAATLFETVTFANVVEGQSLEKQELQIDIRTYAIQTENIMAVNEEESSTDIGDVVADGEANKENENLDEKDEISNTTISPEEVWKVLYMQTVLSKTEREL